MILAWRTTKQRVVGSGCYQRNFIEDKTWIQICTLIRPGPNWDIQDNRKEPDEEQDQIVKTLTCVLQEFTWSGGWMLQDLCRPPLYSSQGHTPVCDGQKDTAGCWGCSTNSYVIFFF